jgi:hypothetical protein
MQYFMHVISHKIDMSNFEDEVVETVVEQEVPTEETIAEDVSEETATDGGPTVEEQPEETIA